MRKTSPKLCSINTTLWPAAFKVAMESASAAASRLEGSKAYSKDFMERHRLPTAAHRTINCIAELDPALDDLPEKVGVKASGLAAGKGVMGCEDASEAESALAEIMGERRFGDAGAKVVVEERLVGLAEGPRFALVDAIMVVPLFTPY